MSCQQTRLVDLTHTIVPGEGARPIRIERVPAPEAVSEGLWYIMHRVEMPLNHVGTHIEAPYHVDPNGNDVSQIPLEQLCGTAAVLDLTSVPAGGVATEDDLRRAAEPAGGLHPGDIALLRFDYDYDAAHVRHFTAEAIGYLVSAGVKLVGTDLLGIELPAGDARLAEQYNHHQLMSAGICLIEQLAHLNQLARPRVTVYALPVPIKGLDSFPLRVVALEEREETRS
ncbi:MAG: cyclase family protein [Chloroflexi bacterium]|nr:cyclase family protein [Chloroflexota bacterium]